MSRELLVLSLGVMPYAEALEFQRNAAKLRIAGDIDQDILLLVEHPPVVTMGRASKANNLLGSPDMLEMNGIDLYEVERGGDITFHGPGQIVGYPIIDLKRHKQDLHWYLRQVEQALIDALAHYQISAERNEGYTGVWTDGKKIASIGVHARDWVTWHGFALNVNTDLSYFKFIVPCGIAGVEMTSIEAETGNPAQMPLVEQSIVSAFGRVFDLQPRRISDLADSRPVLSVPQQKLQDQYTHSPRYERQPGL